MWSCDELKLWIVQNCVAAHLFGLKGEDRGSQGEEWGMDGRERSWKGRWDGVQHVVGVRSRGSSRALVRSVSVSVVGRWSGGW